VPCPRTRRAGWVFSGIDSADLAAIAAAGEVGLAQGTRREQPHRGSQLDFEERDEWRTPTSQPTPATASRPGSTAPLHAPVEDCFRCGRIRSRLPRVEGVRDQRRVGSPAPTAIDLIACTQTILLHDQSELAAAEPTRLRYDCCTSSARVVGPRRPR
jgi:hypothetical protein